MKIIEKEKPLIFLRYSKSILSKHGMIKAKNHAEMKLECLRLGLSMLLEVKR